MRDNLLEYIVCPVCKGELTLETILSDNEVISEGILRCRYCRKDYPVISGVPRLFLDKLSDFNKISSTVWYSHWSKFGSGVGYEYKKYSFHELLSHGIIGQINPEEKKPFDLYLFKNKVVVDLGGGVGQNVTLATSAGAKMCIELDISSAIDIAYRKYIGVDNAEFIQTDLCQSPFRDNSIDFIFSIGVIMNLEDSCEGLREAFRILRPGSFFAFTVLKKECWLGYLHFILNPFKKILLKAVPDFVFLFLSYLLAVPIKITISFYKVFNKTFPNLAKMILPYNTKIKDEITCWTYHTAVGFWYDVFIAPVYHVFTKEKWIQCLNKAGFEIVKFNDYGQVGYASGVFWKIVVKKPAAH